MIHKWLYENHVVLCLGKCPYMLIGNQHQPNETQHQANLDGIEMKSRDCGKLLGLLIDTEK